MRDSKQLVESLFLMDTVAFRGLVDKVGLTTAYVLVQLLDERQHSSKNFSVKQDCLSQDLSLHVRVVRREIKRLQHLGLIRVTKGGFGSPNLYRINLNAIRRLFEDDAVEPVVDDTSHTAPVESVTNRRKNDPPDDHAATTAVTLEDNPQDDVAFANVEVNSPSKCAKEQIEQDLLKREKDNEFPQIPGTPAKLAPSITCHEPDKTELAYWAFIHCFDHENPDKNGSEFAKYLSRFTDDDYRWFLVGYQKSKKRMSDLYPSINCLSTEAVLQAFDEGFDEDTDSDEG